MREYDRLTNRELMQALVGLAFLATGAVCLWVGL